MESIRVRSYDDEGALVSDSGQIKPIFVCGFDPIHHIRHKGRTFKFEMHSYFGPTMLNKLGNPVFPPKPKHPFWAAFAEWARRQLLRKKREEKAAILQRPSEPPQKEIETRRFMRWEGA